MLLKRQAHWRQIAPTLLVALSASTVRVSAQPWSCPEKPVEPCFKHPGRLSSQNGRALTVWLIGTTRRVQVANGLERQPAAVGHYLSMTSPDHSYIYGDFEIYGPSADEP